MREVGKGEELASPGWPPFSQFEKSGRWSVAGGWGAGHADGPGILHIQWELQDNDGWSPGQPHKAGGGVSSDPGFSWLEGCWGFRQNFQGPSGLLDDLFMKKILTLVLFVLSDCK